MIKNTDAHLVSQIFTNEQRVFYRIPKYQREYTWGAREWESLFNDIVSNDKGYFLGSIISVDRSHSSYGDTILDVIDGQQRLTSLSILLATLYTMINEYKDKLDEDQKMNLYNLKKKLVLVKDGGSNTRLTLQIQNNNQADYLSLLCSLQLLENYEKPKWAQNRKIYKAHDSFKKYISQLLEEQKNQTDSFSELVALFDLVDKIYSAVIVNIEVDNYKDAYLLFESLNNRGIPLSAIDLLKNTLLSVAEADGKSDACYEDWKTILNNLGNDYTKQERFFRYYYDAYREELNKSFPVTKNQKYPLGSVATKSNLIDIYEKLINKDYKAFLNRVKQKSEVYSLLINNNTEHELYSEVKDSLLNLEHIQGSPSYILLLYLFYERESLGLSVDDLKDLINYLTAFFVRRNLTDYPNTRNLAKIFMDSIDIAKKNTGSKLVDAIKTHLKNNSSDANAFELRLKGNIYFDNPDVTRFLLCYFEEHFKTNEIYTNLWSKDDKNKYIWTIEHIFPEGENIPQSWIDMIANGDNELAKKYLSDYTHKLGNLTITGYNSSLGNKSFQEKKDRKNEKGAYTGYRNGLKLNEDVVSKEKWTVENITERTTTLVNFFISEFVL